MQPFADEPAGRVLVRAVRGGKAPLRLLPALVLHERGGAKHTPEAEAILRGEADLHMALTTHVALFRAVNVGGRKATSAELQALAADLGLDDARTLLQSGNLVFRSARTGAELEAELERAFARASASPPTCWSAPGRSGAPPSPPTRWRDGRARPEPSGGHGAEVRCRARTPSPRCRPPSRAAR